VFDEPVNGFDGAPQTVYSDHFLEIGPIDGPIGYKLEVPPMHPLLLSTTMTGFGQGHAAMMRQFPHMQGMLALLRDGFHPESAGGNVQLQGDGSPVLDYPISDFVWDGARRALLTMAEIQFAAGARAVQVAHEAAAPYNSWAQAKKAIAQLPYQPQLTRVASAHVMGGCANLSVHDGSLFPTSIGANPQLSIYGITSRLVSGLAHSLTGKPAPRMVASAAPP
jgi:hypothetical protein